MADITIPGVENPNTTKFGGGAQPKFRYVYFENAVTKGDCQQLLPIVRTRLGLRPKPRLLLAGAGCRLVAIATTLPPTQPWRRLARTATEMCGWS